MKEGTPSAGPRFRGLVEPIERLLARVSSGSYHHPIPILVVTLAVTFAAALEARNLRIDTDLTHLLPDSFESVQSLERYEQRSYGVGYVSVVLSGGRAPARRELADDLAPRLEALETIEYVDVRRPDDFFADRALYYLDTEDLETLHERIEERRQWEVRKRSPLYDLGLEPLGDPPPLELDDLRDEYEKAAEQAGVDPEADGGSAYFEDEAAGLLVLLARPGRRSSDVGFNDRVVEQVRNAVADVDLGTYDPSIELALSGRYKKKADQKAQIERDLGLASLLAFVLMLGYLGLHFRRLSALLLVLTPLATGLIWAFGLAAALFGALNLLTGFIGALLLGIGVDHGIHLTARVHAEQAELGAEPTAPEREQAVRRAFGNTGRAVVAAALTTIFAFAGVAISEFRAFREFGVIAAAGLCFIVLAYTTVLPALLSFGKKAKPPRPSPVSRFARSLPRWAPVTGWLAALAFLSAVPFLAHTEFDYDFASLEDADLPAFRLDREVNRLLGRSQTPLVALADDPAHERRIVSAIRERMQERGEQSTIQLVMSLDDLVPDRAEEKAPLVEAIGQSLRDTKPGWLEEEQRDRRERLLEMTEAEPFGRGDLPVEVRRQLVGRKGERSFVLIYPRVSLSDGEGVRRLARELRSIRLEDGRRLDVAGEAMVLADVLDMVVEQSPIVLVFTIVLVVLVLFVLLGPSLVLPCTLAAGTTLVVTAGLMPLVGVTFNYLNIVIVPVLFGMAVDGAVHMLVRHRSLRDVTVVTSETGRAVAGAILTTMLGFGAFTIAHHPGLRSLGQLAVLGLAVNLLVCLVAVTSAMALADRARRLRSEGDGGRYWTRLAVTVGLAGDAPIAPGTLGALIAIPFSLLAQHLGPAVSAVLGGGLTAASVAVTERYLRQTGTKDPKEVVLDELVGCFIAVVMVPHGVVWTVAAFVLFRLLDIYKPWPIDAVENRARGAWSVIGDDVAAGLLAGSILAGVRYAGLSQGWWA